MLQEWFPKFGFNLRHSLFKSNTFSGTSRRAGLLRSPSTTTSPTAGFPTASPQLGRNRFWQQSILLQLIYLWILVSFLQLTYSRWTWSSLREFSRSTTLRWGISPTVKKRDWFVLSSDPEYVQHEAVHRHRRGQPALQESSQGRWWAGTWSWPGYSNVDLPVQGGDVVDLDVGVGPDAEQLSQSLSTSASIMSCSTLLRCSTSTSTTSSRPLRSSACPPRSLLTSLFPVGRTTSEEFCAGSKYSDNSHAC